MTQELKITFVGDLCPSDVVERAFLDGDGERFLKPVVPLFQSSDLIVANLETPLCETASPIRKIGPSFRADPGLVQPLKDLGFGLFCLANNHVLDQDVQGLRRTLEVLEEADIPCCGAGLDHESACAPCVLTLKGRRLAFFNFGDGEFARPAGDGPGTARFELARVASLVRQARSDYDLIVVLLHLGHEYQPLPSPATQAVFLEVEKAGAAAVIGHHPHVPHCVKSVGGAPVATSLGNFLFGRTLSKEPGWRLSVVLQLAVTDGEIGFRVIPFRQNDDMTLGELSDTGREAFNIYLQRCSEIVQDQELHQRLWEQEVRRLFQGRIGRWARCASRLSATAGNSLPSQLMGWAGSGATVSLGDAAAEVYHMVQSRAHNEVVQTACMLMMEDRFLPADTTARQELDELHRLLRTALAP